MFGIKSFIALQDNILKLHLIFNYLFGITYIQCNELPCNLAAVSVGKLHFAMSKFEKYDF